MPPKPSGKQLQKQKAKVVEDKTFGMKNKKGAKAQQFVEQIERQADANIAAIRGRNNADAEERRRAKAEKEEYDRQMAILFRGTVAPVNVSKTFIVADAKHAFVEHVEEEVKEKKKDRDTYEVYIEETEGSILEDDLEKERLALPEGGTPLTFETFVAWKKAKLVRLQVAEEEKAKADAAGPKKGKGVSGRQLFETRQDLFVDDDEAEVAYDRSDLEGVDIFDVDVTGTSIALKKREGGGAVGGAAAMDGVDEEGEEDDGSDGDASSDAGGGGAAAVAVAIQENLFLEEDVELPEDFE